MIRFGWFCLTLRLIGVALIAFALPGVANATLELTYSGVANSSFTGQAFWWMVLGVAPTLVQCAIGAYLLFGGRWLVERCLRGIDTLCPICAYDVSTVATDLCPECGFRFRLTPPPEPPKAPPTP